MAKSPADIEQDIEQKVSNEALPLPEPLVYTNAIQFEGNISEIEAEQDIERLVCSSVVLREMPSYGIGLAPLKEILEKYNISVNARMRMGYTPLMMAAEKHQLRTVIFLLREKVDLSLVQGDGETALRCALQARAEFQYADYVIARHLIEAGADIDQADRDGFTPLLRAWSYGNQNAANQLILLGANVDHNEHLFNVLRADDVFGWEGFEGVPQQIALSKQHPAYIERAKQLGHRVIGDATFQLMNNENISREVIEFLFAGNLAAIVACDAGRKTALQAVSKQHPAPAPKKLLPIPRSVSFMPYFNSLMSQPSSDSRLLPENVVSDLSLLQQQASYQEDWQRWQETYHDEDDTYPLRKQPGYGPGAMVVKP